MTRRSFVGVPTIKYIMQIKGGNPDSTKRWRTEKAEIKDHRKYSMKTARNGSPGAREHIVKRKENVSSYPRKDCTRTGND